MPPRDVSYSPHALGGVTEHRVYATKPRPPAVTLGMLALHGYAAWRLWHADLSVRALRSLAHWDAAAWRALVSVPSLLLVAYLVVLLRISDQLVYGKFVPRPEALGHWRIPSCILRLACRPFPGTPGLPPSPHCARMHR